MAVAEEPSTDECPPGVLINEVQLILAEKRTSLAGLRTGIAVSAIPLSIMGVLVATSRSYDILKVLPLFIPVMVLNALLLGLDGYLIISSILKLHREDRLIREIKPRHSTISQLLA